MASTIQLETNTKQSSSTQKPAAASQERATKLASETVRSNSESRTLELDTATHQSISDRRSITKIIMNGATAVLHVGARVSTGTVKSIPGMVDAMATGWLKQDDKSLPGSSKSQTSKKEDSSSNSNKPENTAPQETQQTEGSPVNSQKKNPIRANSEQTPQKTPEEQETEQT